MDDATSEEERGQCMAVQPNKKVSVCGDVSTIWWIVVVFYDTLDEFENDVKKNHNVCHAFRMMPG